MPTFKKMTQEVSCAGRGTSEVKKKSQEGEE